jgi:F420H(2)-dependent quinone reductase
MADKSLFLKLTLPFTHAHKSVYRMSGGKIGGTMGDAKIALLTTTGRKSGKLRTVPLLYLEDGDNYAVIASRGGDDRHPAWYHNLTSNPEVELEIGADALKLRARVASDEEHARIWQDAVSRYADYEKYQAGTTRAIPVVVLEPR